MSDVPVLIRRTTMLVNDIEPSLQIYRDILGMSVHYDEEILVSGDGLPAGEPNSQTRLVMLKCKDDFIGMLGILQYIDPPLPEPPPRLLKESNEYSRRISWHLPSKKIADEAQNVETITHNEFKCLICELFDFFTC